MDGAVNTALCSDWGIMLWLSFSLGRHSTCTLFLSLGKSCCVAEIKADVAELYNM